MTGSQDRGVWIGLGATCLALVFLFVIVGLSMLGWSGGGGANPWPPTGYLIRLTVFTIGQAFASTILSLLFAVPVALALSRRPRFPGRSFVVGLMLLPLGLPVLPAVFGLVEIWGRQGLVTTLLRRIDLENSLSIYGLGGILLAHVFFNLPLAARLMSKALGRVASDEWLLAAELDFSRVSLFRFIEWPALLRVIPGIAGLIFMLCVTSFTIILTLGGGPQTSTLEVAIYQALKFDYDPPRALVLSAVQLVLTMIAFGCLRFVPDPEQDQRSVSGRVFRMDGRTSASKLCDGLILSIFLLFVATPLIAIVVEGLGADLVHLFSDPLFHQALLTSLVIAAAAGLLSVLLTFLILRARAALGVGGLRSLFRLPEFMLLIPPLTLGSGWFILSLRTGLDGGSPLMIVTIINALMAMPFAVRAIEPELRTHLLRSEKLAESLGMAGVARFRLIDWPVLRSPLLTALSFAMSLSLGDMGAIALFGTDSFLTLPSLLYAKLGSYRSTDAAGIALVLGVLCLLLMVPALISDRPHGERI